MQNDIDKVIEGGYCIGCGVCPFVDSAFSIGLNNDGKYQAHRDGEETSTDWSCICPFANAQYNEDAIGKEHYGSIEGIKHNADLGFFLETYVGHVSQGNFRDKGSSGGMVSWVVAKLFEEDKIDAVIHVKPSEKPGIMYAYQISNSVAELETGAKSKYYPIELSHVLEYVKNNDRRYAIIGVPCFIKAIRMLERQDAIIQERIKYHIGLVCGHLKSSFFALSEAWEAGIKPENVQNVDFRYKMKGHLASDYAIKATGVNQEGKPVEVIKPTRELSTTDWGVGYFKYNACEYCDDVLAETADITCGDAWLPGYVHDDGGTNVVVVRTPEMKDLIERNRSEISLETIDPSLVSLSQASGLRHRREGLAYRLYRKDEHHEWRPTKRVEPSNKLSRQRRKVYRYRLELIEQSFVAYHEAMKQGENFSVFVSMMKPLLQTYRRADRPLWRRVARKIKRTLKQH